MPSASAQASSRATEAQSQRAEEARARERADARTYVASVREILTARLVGEGHSADVLTNNNHSVAHLFGIITREAGENAERLLNEVDELGGGPSAPVLDLLDREMQIKEGAGPAAEATPDMPLQDMPLAHQLHTVLHHAVALINWTQGCSHELDFGSLTCQDSHINMIRGVLSKLLHEEGSVDLVDDGALHGVYSQIADNAGDITVASMQNLISMVAACGEIYYTELDLESPEGVPDGKGAEGPDENGVSEANGEQDADEESEEGQDLVFPVLGHSPWDAIVHHGGMVVVVDFMLLRPALEGVSDDTKAEIVTILNDERRGRLAQRDADKPPEDIVTSRTGFYLFLAEHLKHLAEAEENDRDTVMTGLLEMYKLHRQPVRRVFKPPAPGEVPPEVSFAPMKPLGQELSHRINLIINMFPPQRVVLGAFLDLPKLVRPRRAKRYAKRLKYLEKEDIMYKEDYIDYGNVIRPERKLGSNPL